MLSRVYEYYLISGKIFIFPEMLADKLEAFDNIRRSLPSFPRRHVKGRVYVQTQDLHIQLLERMFQVFKDKGLPFQEITLAMSLADGQQNTGEVLLTQVMAEIEGRSVSDQIHTSQRQRGNRTLLGTYFLLVLQVWSLDVKNTCCYSGTILPTSSHLRRIGHPVHS
ncbi:hypothetical protein TNCV_2158421 [Trichonephila clavipes]|nr:hypothetical protein TNCV_2158421 [Trichonephila clavipes]